MGAESVLSDSACTWALQLINGFVASLSLNGSAAFGKTTLDLRSDTLMHVSMHTPAQLHPRTRCMLVKLTQQSSRKQGSEAGSQYLREHFIHAVYVTVILLVVIYQSEAQGAISWRVADADADADAARRRGGALALGGKHGCCSPHCKLSDRNHCTLTTAPLRMKLSLRANKRTQLALRTDSRFVQLVLFQRTSSVIGR